MFEQNKRIEILKEHIISAAKYFLEDAGEFYPFGCLLLEDNTLKPIGVYWGNEHPQSLDVLNELEQLLANRIKTERGLIGAIGLDIFINILDEKKSAFEIRMYDKDSLSKFCLLYYKKGNIYKFENYNI